MFFNDKSESGRVLVTLATFANKRLISQKVVETDFIIKSHAKMT